MNYASGIYRTVWNRQEGKCYYCGQAMRQDETIMALEVPCNKGREQSTRHIYIHRACATLSYCERDLHEMPPDVRTTMEVLMDVRAKQLSTSSDERWGALSDFFRDCSSTTVSLTFDEMYTKNFACIIVIFSV